MEIGGLRMGISVLLIIDCIAMLANLF